MRRTSVWGLTIAALAGAAIASCNFTLGVDPYLDAGDKASSASSGSGGAHGGAGGGGMGGTGGVAIPAGAAVWAHALGTSGDDTVKAIAVSQTTGNIFLTGKTGAAGALGCPNVTDAGGPSMGGYLIEVDEQGACVWGVFFGLGAEGTGVAVDGNGYIALTGTFTGDLSLYTFAPSQGHQSSFVARIRPTKALQWAHLVASDAMNTATTTSLAMNGNHVYCGGSSNGKLIIDSVAGDPPVSGGQDGFVLDCDTADAGACKVSVTISGNGTTDQQVLGVAVSPDASELSIAGVSGGDTGFNSSTALPAPAGTSMSPNAILGSFLASNYHVKRNAMFGNGKSQSGQCVAYAGSGALFFAGTYDGALEVITPPLMNNASPSVFLARFDQGSVVAGGAVSLAATMSGMNAEDVHGLAADVTGNVVMVGTLRGKASLGSLSATSAGDDDIYVARLDKALKPLWLTSFGTATGAESADAVALTADGGIIVAGHFNGKSSFHLGKNVLSTNGGDDIFIARLKP